MDGVTYFYCEDDMMRIKESIGNIVLTKEDTFWCNDAYIPIESPGKMLREHRPSPCFTLKRPGVTIFVLDTDLQDLYYVSARGANGRDLWYSEFQEYFADGELIIHRQVSTKSARK